MGLASGPRGVFSTSGGVEVVEAGHLHVLPRCGAGLPQVRWPFCRVPSLHLEVTSGSPALRGDLTLTRP